MNFVVDLVQLSLFLLVFSVDAFTLSLWSRDHDLESFRNGSRSPYISLFRSVRQVTTFKCGKTQWECTNGECIANDEVCDGIKNCKDSSDETFVVCRNFSCPDYLFRCTYGACVNGDAKCNKKKECDDNSDELHKDCRKDEVRDKCDKRKFQCDNGECIDNDMECDGASDCSDGSDETVKQCTGLSCAPHLFKCAYGACVDGDANCNNVRNCADGSDELPALCHNVPGYNETATKITTTTTTTTTTELSPTGDYCIIPSPPDNGKYYVGNVSAIAGSRIEIYQILIYSCDKSYHAIPGNTNYCDENGQWLDLNIECLRKCKSLTSYSVDLTCERLGANTTCDGELIHGTVVHVKCKPFHIPPRLGMPTILKCLNGDWDYTMPVCESECGEEKSEGTKLSINSTDEKRGNSPWHVAVYRNIDGNFTHTCGGTIITNKIVISAAHCFHIDTAGTIMDETNFAIGAGKYYRSWDHEENNKYKYIQRSLISKIHVPPFYGGMDQNLQHDIALLILETQLSFSDSVHSVCLDLSSRSSVANGTLGKGVGWGVTIEGEKDSVSKNLKAVTIPFVDYQTCKTAVPSPFKRFLTADKFCAGWLNGTALCSGDSGGGLVFPETVQDIKRFYLRGIVSVSDLDNTRTTCRKDMYTAFTAVLLHDTFISNIIHQYK